MRDRFWHFFREIFRVRWPLFFAFGVLVARQYGWLPPDNVATLVLYKLSLASMGFVAAHIAWQQAFDYVDMGDMLEVVNNGEMSYEARIATGLMLIGMCFLRGLIYFAFMVGITTGL